MTESIWLISASGWLLKRNACHRLHVLWNKTQEFPCDYDISPYGNCV